MMKRAWSVILTLGLCVSLMLSGCQHKDTEENKTEVKESESDQAGVWEEVQESEETKAGEKLAGLVPDEKSQELTELEEKSEEKQQETTQDKPWQKTQDPSLSEVVNEPPVCADSDFVRVKDYIPDIVVDLKYATSDNFTGQVIYNFKEAYLRYGTVQKLKVVQDQLRAMGLGLKIWDAYRPVSAQERLWEVYPDPVYVANPANGITSHSRGDTIDITLVYADGSDVWMPTGFDDFSVLADRDYSDCDEQAAANAMLLENMMLANGFTGYAGEWWDFSDVTQYWDGMMFEPLS